MDVLIAENMEIPQLPKGQYGRNGPVFTEICGFKKLLDLNDQWSFVPSLQPKGTWRIFPKHPCGKAAKKSPRSVRNTRQVALVTIQAAPTGTISVAPPPFFYPSTSMHLNKKNQKNQTYLSNIQQFPLPARGKGASLNNATWQGSPSAGLYRHHWAALMPLE